MSRFEGTIEIAEALMSFGGDSPSAGRSVARRQQRAYQAQGGRRIGFGDLLGALDSHPSGEADPSWAPQTEWYVRGEALRDRSKTRTHPTRQPASRVHHEIPKHELRRR
jgi:hypothetical protein